jgi:hypothetical protein
MERAFNKLKQGGMSVAEYTMKFNELVRYVADGNDAPTEAWKMTSTVFVFIRGRISCVATIPLVLAKVPN